MPRPAKPPHLQQKRTPSGSRVWVIRDGADRISTGCRVGADDAQAQRKLADYINGKYAPPKGVVSLIDEIVAAYLTDHAEHSRSRQFLHDTAKPILRWWSGKKLEHITGTNCRKYVTWRTSQVVRGRLVSDQTARHDLKTLRAAIRWFKREHDASLAVPIVTLPTKAPPRMDYWLGRDEVARRVKAARKSPRTKHVARMLLIGVYTGTRPGAILGLRWLPSPTNGWFDLDAGVLYRVGSGAKRSKKRQPPAKIHFRLLPHLKRWRAADMAAGIVAVVHYQGEPVVKLRNSWKSVSGGAADGPHVLRHTAATWLMQVGIDVFEAAGYLGMTVDTLLEVYGHHHPTFQEKAAHSTSRRRR
jgi:integrase